MAESRVPAPLEPLEALEDFPADGLSEIGSRLPGEDDGPGAQTDERTKLGLEVNEEFSGGLRVSPARSLEKAMRIHVPKSIPLQRQFTDNLATRRRRPPSSERVCCIETERYLGDEVGLCFSIFPEFPIFSVPIPTTPRL